MNILGVSTLFESAILDRLPINYRYMTRIETNTFGEHYIGRRFSTSAAHYAHDFMTHGLYKPLSDRVYSELAPADFLPPIDANPNTP